MTDTHFIFTNAMNWAIIASSALGVFCQYVDKTHRDDFLSFSSKLTAAQRKFEEKTDRSNVAAEQQHLEEARGITSVSMMYPIVMLFGIVFLITLFNCFGIFLVWFEDWPIVETVKTVLSIDKPLHSYRGPLFFIACTLTCLCIFVLFELTIVKIKQKKIAYSTVKIQDI